VAGAIVILRHLLRVTAAFGTQHSVRLNDQREEGAKHSRFGARRPLQQTGRTPKDSLSKRSGKEHNVFFDAALDA